MITKVKVVTGNALAQLDTTGTLTQKYQARLIPRKEKAELITDQDTETLRAFVGADVDLPVGASPVNHPRPGQLLPIGEAFDRLKPLVGESFADIGHDQERNRGVLLHQLVCHHLGYTNFRDDGQFPDVRHQLLEVKLQTSPTIDLGLVRPDSEDALDVPRIEGRQIRHCDVRYAVFYAETDGKNVTLTHLFLSTGLRFFTRFPQFQGNGAVQVNPESRLIGNIAEHELWLIPSHRVLRNPNLIPVTAGLNDVRELPCPPSCRRGRSLLVRRLLPCPDLGSSVASKSLVLARLG